MRRLARALAAVGVGVAAACGESPTGVTGLEGGLSFLESGGDQSTEAHILVHAVGAPSLETYQGQFWAVRGKDQKYKIRYLNVDDDDHGSFLQLNLGEESLVAGPDGTPLAKGDSVLITVVVDPTRLLIDFEPSGLTFSPEERPKLTLWYLWADPDFNRDGVVDQLDEAIEDQLGMWSRTDPTSGWQWEPVSHSKEKKRLSGHIDHFSGYTVSW